MRTIGIDASRANTPHRTGTEWYSWHLLQEWLAQPHTDKYELYLRSKLQDDMPPLGQNTQALYLHWPPKILWTYARLSLRMLVRPPDTLFVPAHTIPLIHPIDTVTTCHDVGFERFPELYSKKEISYHRFSMRLAIKNARTLITISNFSKREIQKYYDIPDEKIVVIHLGFSPSLILPKKTEINYLDKFNIRKPYILNIARLEKKKNTDGLLRAFEILRKKYPQQLQLVLAGDWGQYVGDIKEIFTRHKFSQDIIITGYTDATDKQILLENALVFVFPSRYEGFGLPTLEAMASGIPVVCSDAGSLPEVCADAAIYAPVEDPNSLADQLQRAISDVELRQVLIAKGKARVKNYTWKKCAEQTMHIIQGK